jgi:hypothetical protein
VYRTRPVTISDAKKTAPTCLNICSKILPIPQIPAIPFLLISQLLYMVSCFVNRYGTLADGDRIIVLDPDIITDPGREHWSVQYVCTFAID